MTRLATIQIRRASLRRSTTDKIKQIDRAKRRTNKHVARFMQLQAKNLAPFAKGDLVNSINIVNKSRQRNAKFTVVVSAVGPGGFPYPRWTNQSAGFVTVKMRWTKPPFQPVRYGDGTHRITAQSLQFWKTAAIRTRTRFKGIALNNFNKELKVSLR